MALNKHTNNSFKSRAFILLTAVVVILSAVAVAISISVSSTMLRRQDQLEGVRPDATESLKGKNSGLDGVMNLKKAEQWPAFFNGRLQEGLVSYTTDKGKSLLPVDILLDNLKADYGILNSDDVFKADVNGKKLKLDLGTRNASAGGSTIELDTASMAAENHVLASPMILDYLEGIKYYSDVDNKAAFTDYWPSSMNKKYSGIRLFKINDRTVEISDLFGGKPFIFGDNGPAAIDEAVYSKSLDSLLIKSGEEYYNIAGNDYTKPAKLNINGSWSLAPDGSFLYRVDDTDKYFLIYDIKSASLKRLKNHYSSVVLTNGASLTACRLLAQQVNSRFVRLDFEGPGGETYTTIARNGKIVAQGNSSYSPDHARLLLYNASDGWSLSGSDGRGIVHFEDVSSVVWVDNGRILLRTDSGLKVFESKDCSRHMVEVPFYYMGKADDGRLFFGKGNELYQIVNGKEEIIADLPWKCDYASSTDSKGPVILVSEEADGIFGLSGDITIALGKPGLFPNLPAPDSEDAGFNSNAALSPGGGRLALLQKGEKFLEVSLFGLKDLKLDKLTLDYVPDAYTTMPAVFIKWLGDDSLVVYTANRGWLIGFDKDAIYMHEWSDNASIAGTFQLLQ